MSADCSGPRRRGVAMTFFKAAERNDRQRLMCYGRLDQWYQAPAYQDAGSATIERREGCKGEKKATGKRAGLCCTRSHSQLHTNMAKQTHPRPSDLEDTSAAPAKPAELN